MPAPGVLFHLPFHPASRAARLVLEECRVAFTDTPVRPWEPDSPLLTLNPSGMPPVLQIDSLTLCELDAILGWLNDSPAGARLLPERPAERAETRRLLGWFSHRFSDEVDAVLLHERMEKPLLRLGPPEAQALREGREALKMHLGQFEALLGQRDWLAGRALTAADLVAAAHLSVLDYFGEVAWGHWRELQTWYMRVKSRPCFRPLLADRFPGVAPAACYADLDF
jgi:glutathione S-transferase